MASKPDGRVATFPRVSRCAGCGALVSEFAAWCPTCRRSTDDPLELDPYLEASSVSQKRHRGQDCAEGLGAGGGRPLRHLRRPLLIGVVIAVATTALAVEALSSRGETSKEPGLPAAVRALKGRIIAEAEDGTLFLSHPDGSHRTAMRLHPFVANAKPVLVEGDGEVVSLAQKGFSGALYAGPSSAVPAGGESDSFADGAKAVIVMAGEAGPGSSSPVSMVTLAAGDTISLGIANDAEGDPETLGAFVSLAAPDQTPEPTAGIDGLADTEIALRDRGGRTVVLATTAQLDHDADQDPSEPINLTLFPDRDGTKIAVLLNPIGDREGNAAMVILDRHGHLLGTVGRGEGPTEYTTPYWSPDGDSLAYATFGSVGTTLAVLNRSYSVATQALQPTTRLVGCTWSPQSTWVLCLAAFESSTESSDNWLLAENDGSLAPIYSFPATGNPVAWLP